MFMIGEHACPWIKYGQTRDGVVALKKADPLTRHFD
ncbi:hypothetical protein QFZ76_003714 [Streptomyces sp. V4I2]|nr:hypothetical protein [Streptomyces sp. V4I2]